MRNIDKFRGCLLGGAAGDALGYEIEFMREEQIFKKFGPQGITEYRLHNGVAEISDDTQMTLFTATGLLFGTTRGMTRGIMSNYEGYIRFSYEDWYFTQTAKYPLFDNYHSSWLVNVPEMFSRRAPGNTCMSAIGSRESGSVLHPINSSKGCGGVMRVAPVGLYFCDRPVSYETTDKLGAETAALTHGHELGWLPAAALVHIVRRLAENENEEIEAAVLDAVEALPKLYPDAKHMDAFISLLRKAVSLAHEDLDDLSAVHRLGEGWVGDEALAIAVFCAVRFPHDFEKALIASVNHKGDSDSTGSITGNILGASLGLQGIPDKFLENLELKDIIREVADDLYNDCRAGESGACDDPVWKAKYIEICWPKPAESLQKD